MQIHAFVFYNEYRWHWKELPWPTCRTSCIQPCVCVRVCQCVTVSTARGRKEEREKQGKWRACKHTCTRGGQLCCHHVEEPLNPRGRMFCGEGGVTVCFYPQNAQVLGAAHYRTCVKLSAEDEARVQPGWVTPQMSDSGKCRSISEDLKLSLIDSALWESLEGPLAGN